MLLSATHLTRRFGERLALDDVSLELRPGEILALLGPNGAGKTTTLRILCGLIAPTAGTVHIGAHRLTSDNGAIRRNIGLLTESPGLWDRLTVRENLMTYARLYGLSDPARAVTDTLHMLDVGDRAGQMAGQLSKGLRQRVALARALMHEPRIVLLDEPTSGLDPESARDVRALVVQLRDRGRAVLLSSHNLDEVERIADRIAVLQTRLIALDTPEGLRAQQSRRHLRITVRDGAERFASVLRLDAHLAVQTVGSELVIQRPSRDGGSDARDAIDTPGIVRMLVAHGAEIEAVVIDEPSLEDTYLRLVRPHV